MDHVLTLIRTQGPALSASEIAPIGPALERLGADLGAITWLQEGAAADLPFTGLDADQAETAARSALDGAAVDVVAQHRAGRAKRLLIADMDATMVQEETLDEIARALGVVDQVAPITARAMAGELDFEAALRERVALLKGAPETVLTDVWSRVQLMPGAEALLAGMKAAGAVCLLVSGGFTWVTGRVAERLGFQEHYGNVLEIVDGRMTGDIVPPVRGANAKLETLVNRASAHGVALEDCLGVGDGANDIPMLKACGMGVAFRAKPRTAAAARARIDHSDLTALLYIQGLRPPV